MNSWECLRGNKLSRGGGVEVRGGNETSWKREGRGRAGESIRVVRVRWLEPGESLDVLRMGGGGIDQEPVQYRSWWGGDTSNDGWNPGPWPERWEFDHELVERWRCRHGCDEVDSRTGRHGSGSGYTNLMATSEVRQATRPAGYMKDVPMTMLAQWCQKSHGQLTGPWVLWEDFYSKFDRILVSYTGLISLIIVVHWPLILIKATWLQPGRDGRQTCGDTAIDVIGVTPSLCHQLSTMLEHYGRTCPEYIKTFFFLVIFARGLQSTFS